ncbi:hypothetical protein EYM_00895 [Ignicoccus islandicus DSM 13165]|uniref:Uncharacterized protein n=1 Tax=Ignicoccus islandicus DSM 13165 TaxID=940295 RepID=A0A0U3F1K5_9CREN|nr:hypothetical protein [Ignicoccus islandicus]ALU11429.1 hypothetical protein EYM_00895 [Ignicoccus islandicus DSM 13165]
MFPFVKVTERLKEHMLFRWIGLSKEDEVIRYYMGQPLILTSWEELEGLRVSARSVEASATKYGSKSLRDVKGSDLIASYYCFNENSCKLISRKLSEAVKRKGAVPWFLYNGESAFAIVSWKCYNYGELKSASPSYLMRKIVEDAGFSPYEVLPIAKFLSAPYSLHKSLNLVNVPLKSDNVMELAPSLASPDKASGDDDAIDSCEGDLNDYVKAVEKEVPTNPRHPGRFPVMGLLQAVRYYILSGDVLEALSFGLNRAIFYAWLKYHYNPSKIRRPRGYSEEELERIEKLRPLGPLKDKAPRSGKWFEIGGQVQRPEDFFKQVAKKFDYSGMPFEIAWDRAFEYVSLFPEHVLRDPNLFFKYVYEPVRDNFLLVYKREARPKLPPVHRYRSLFDFKK